MNETNKTPNAMVTVKIISSSGHDEFVGDAVSALAKIQEETAKNAKWVYIDGGQFNPENLTVDQLLNAEDITLTNALAGGVG
jgi:hypothetical protein